MTEEERILKEFHQKLIENMTDLPPEFSAMVDKYFWDLIYKEENKDDLEAV